MLIIGNRLQAFALNFFLNERFKNFKSYSLLFNCYDEFKFTKTSFKDSVKMKIQIIKRLIKENILGLKKNDTNVEFKTFTSKYSSIREKLCNDFTLKYTQIPHTIYNWNLIKESDFDIFIVGSDVVWAQVNNGINRMRFLDFTTKKKIKRIAYSASLGRDWIPNENIKYIKKCLKKFDGISVRESSTIELLNSIGIKKVIHTCDPTLLLKQQKWAEIEHPVRSVNNKFIFVYLLGKVNKHREFIVNLSKRFNYKIATIPNADGVENLVDVNFGDFIIDDCSPENWLWLIHNSEYVVTDSFHGVVFSTIFEKKFIVLKREYVIDINNRMLDYLKYIKQEDKYIDINQELNINELCWNYKDINERINALKDKSIKYLDEKIK